MKFEPGVLSLNFECRLIGLIWRSRMCVRSRVALSIGVGGALAPWDLIPDRIPIFGHLDELAFIVTGLAIARYLIPPRLKRHVAWKLGVVSAAKRDGRWTRLEMWSAMAVSELLAQWLVFRRRIFRLGIYSASSVRKAWSRSINAIRQGDVGGFFFTLLGYRLWWSLRSPFARPQSDVRSVIVIGGAARSGTTLLRTILGRHPLIASGSETTVFLYRVSSPDWIAERFGWKTALIERWQRDSRSQMEFIERFYHAILEQSGKAIWVEKTPRNVRRFPFIRRRFPLAKLVHIIRDGRDVVCSQRHHPYAKLDHALWHSTAAARRCAVQWRASVKAGLRFRDDPAYYELRYEDLVLNPELTLRALFGFLDVPWDDCVLEASSAALDDPDEAAAAREIFESSIGRWRRDLSQADRDALRPLIGPLIVELGYENGLIW